MPAVSLTPKPTQFVESVDYLKGKIPEGSQAWNDLAGSVHSKVFTVAGSGYTDLAKDMHEAVVKVRESGGTLSDFRKDFDQIVAKHGWSYKGTRGWRTRVIYEANMGSAMMAGRWQQLQENKAERPYLQYRTAGDSRVRKEHAQWNGIIRHIDDPFWRTHYPPNGWLCRCVVRAYNDRELGQGNLTVTKDLFHPTYRTVVDKDGAITDSVPVGIDPGWDHNVGQSWASPELALGQKLVSLPKFLRGPLTDKTITPAFQKAIEGNWKRFQSAVKASGKPDGSVQILGFLDSTLMTAIEALPNSIKLESSAIATLDKTTDHLKGSHKGRAKSEGGSPDQVWPAEWIDELPSLLRNYRAVFWDMNNDALVVIPTGSFNDKIPKIAMRLNRKTKQGKVVQVVSLGSAQQNNLTEASGYRLLLGSLK